MKDKRQKATNVKCKREESLTKQSILILWITVFSRRSIWVLLELCGRWTQHFTKINHFLPNKKIQFQCPFPSLTLFLIVSLYITRKAYHTVWIFSNFDCTSLKKGCNFCNSNHTFIKQHYLLSFEKRLHDLQRPSHCTFQECELKIKAHWISFKTV